jgi:hypothetical protein
LIIEYTYDNRKICYKCKWLKMVDDWFGDCTCPNNRVKNRHREITDRKCSFKSTKEDLID